MGLDPLCERTRALNLCTKIHIYYMYPPGSSELEIIIARPAAARQDFCKVSYHRVQSCRWSSSSSAILHCIANKGSVVVLRVD